MEEQEIWQEIETCYFEQTCSPTLKLYIQQLVQAYKISSEEAYLFSCSQTKQLIETAIQQEERVPSSFESNGFMEDQDVSF